MTLFVLILHPSDYLFLQVTVAAARPVTRVSVPTVHGFGSSLRPLSTPSLRESVKVAGSGDTVVVSGGKTLKDDLFGGE